MTRDNKYGLVAFIVIVGVCALFFWLAWEGVDYKKWFGLTLWTLCIFGSVVFLHAERLKMLRCLLVFLALLALHVTLLVFYLRSARFPNVFFLFFAPFEGAAIIGIVVLVAGERSHRGHRIKQS